PVVIFEGVTEAKGRHFLSTLEEAGGKGRLEPSTIPNPMMLTPDADRLLEWSWLGIKDRTDD
ncbi:unnamed protein product, partial [Laminaria digitata]